MASCQQHDPGFAAAEGYGYDEYGAFIRWRTPMHLMQDRKAASPG